MKRNRVRWIVLIAWLLPTIALGLVVGLAPDVVTREADAGNFVSAELRPGGYFASSVMTVQTTRGTLAVDDYFSALRGTPLVVVDTSLSGLRVCSKAHRAVCSRLFGLYVGDLVPVPHAPVWMTRNTRNWLSLLALSWGILGLAVFLLTLVATDNTLDDSINQAGGNSP